MQYWRHTNISISLEAEDGLSDECIYWLTTVLISLGVLYCILLTEGSLDTVQGWLRQGYEKWIPAELKAWRSL